MVSCRIAWISVTRSTNSRSFAPWRDLEPLEAQARNSIGRRDDALVEREIVGLAGHRGLQLAERPLDLAVGLLVQAP